MQKRILSLALAAVLVLSLSACGSKNGDNSSSSGQETTAGVAVQTEEVVLSDISTENKVSGKVVADSEHTIMVGVSAKCTAVYV